MASPDQIEELLAQLRPLLAAEGALLLQVPVCETEADLLAHQRQALRDEARAAVEAWLAQHGNDLNHRGTESTEDDRLVP